MPATVAEFKALARRIITLPHSRLDVEVKMISCAAFFGLGELPDADHQGRSRGLEQRSTIPR